MRANWKEDQDLPSGRVYDLATGEPIPSVFFIDEETDEYEHHVLDADGLPMLDRAAKQIVTARGRGRILFVPFEQDCGSNVADEPVVIVGVNGLQHDTSGLDAI